MVGSARPMFYSLAISSQCSPIDNPVRASATPGTDGLRFAGVRFSAGSAAAGDHRRRVHRWRYPHHPRCWNRFPRLLDFIEAAMEAAQLDRVAPKPWRSGPSTLGRSESTGEGIGAADFAERVTDLDLGA